MKKYLKTYAKKSMSLLMAVLMLMTCWVFVAPEKAEAAAPDNYVVTMDFSVSDACNGANATATVYYMPNNGTGTETSTTWNLDQLESTEGTYSLSSSGIGGWPSRIVFAIGNIGMRTANVALTGISINGEKVLSGTWTADLGWNGSFSRDFIPNTRASATADGLSGTVGGLNEGTWSWERPEGDTVYSAPSAQTITVPNGGGSASKTFSATFKDQYGVYWTGGGYSYSIDPKVGTLSYDNSKTVTVSATESVFSSLKDYDASSGKGTATLTIGCGKASTTATVTFQSSLYYVYFQDAVDTHTTSCYYNGSVTAPAKGCAKAADENYHYAFEKWNDNVLSGITANKTVTSTYTEIKHTFMGDFQANGDFTHSRMCTGEGADTACTYYGLNGVTYGSVSCLDTPSWTGGDDSAHHGVCNECGNNLVHYPDSNNLWVEVVDAKYRKSEPDCTNPAVYYKSCKVCGQASTTQTFTDGSAMGHSFVVIGHVDPTCTTNGYDTYGCENCGDTSLNYNKEFDDAGDALYPAAHSWHYLTEDRNDGTHGVRCTECDEWKDIESHNYAQAGIVTRADCTNDAVYNFRCGKCGNTTQSKYKFDSDTKQFTTELIQAALGHDWAKVVDADHPEVAPTCSATGSYWEQCSRTACKIYEQRTVAIDPNAHQYSSATSNNDGTHTATCQLNSSHVVTEPCTDADKNCVCDACGYNIPHDYQNIVDSDMLISDADCNSYAVYKKSCSVCGVAHDTDTFEDVDAGYGAHNWDETEKYIKSVAKCETDAVYYNECLECGCSSETVDGSTWTDVGSGYAHNFNGTIVNNNNGTHSYTCSNVDTDGVACTVAGGTVDCTYGEWDINNANGHQRTCLDCGYTTTLEAHKWAEDGGEGWVPAEGNTGSAGQMTRTCLICSRTETTACVYDSEKVVDATCLNDKYTEYTCTTCGHGYTVIEAGTRLGHSYTGDYDIDAENDQHRQLCVNGCDEHGEWVACTLEYSQITGTETHTATCPDCGNVDTGDCSGGKATCIEKAKCDKCDGYHGDYADHDFSGTAVNAGEGKHKLNCSTEGCNEYGEAVDCYGGTAYCDAKKVCDACKTAYGDLDPDNHKNTTAQPGKAPTCMQTGYTDYATCDACGEELGKEKIDIDPDAHKWDSTAVSTDDGKHYYACTNEDADGNVCAAKDVYDCVCTSPSILPPTCEEAGHTKNYCDECNYYWETEPTEPIGHAWGEWTEDGQGGHTRVCGNDNTHVETGVCADDATAVVTAPTCTEQGYTTYTCNVCGYVWVSDFVDATGHHYTQKIIDDAHIYTDIVASCTAAQHYWFDCKDCDKNAKDEADHDKYPLNTLYYQNGTADGHTFTGKAYSESIKDKLVLATEATCTEHETYYTYCTECHLSTKGIEGVEATFTRWGTALEHSYKDIVDEANLAKNRVSVATCTAKAVYYKSCETCGDVSEDTFTYGEMTDHVYTKKVADYGHIITEANCTTAATYWYNCEYCNSNAKLIDKTDMTDDEVAALQFSYGTVDMNNHTELTKVAYKAPTCIEDGHSEYKKCAACDTEIGKVTKGYEKTGHSYTGSYRIANVVDTEGNVTAYKHQRACKYGCGEYSTASDCGFSAWVQNEDGKTHSKSCVCGNSITADCVANDNQSCEEQATCKDCGGNVEGTSTGHAWGEWKSDENGKTHSRVCANNTKHVETEDCSGGDASGCGAIYCDVCSQQYATGVTHDWSEWVDTAAATCTEPAKHKRSCKACTATEEVSYGEALGHDYDKDNDGTDDGVVTKEATCTEAGITTYTCLNNCGTTYTDVIKSLGHDLADEWTTTQEPTCKDEGIQVKKCTHSWKDADGNEVNCDYAEEQTIPADKSKHVSGEWVADEGASNCETGLKSYKYCTVCGLKVDEKTEQISHDWKADTIVYGTCTANGYINMICAKCGSAKVFDENTPGFPNKLDDTVIDGETAAKLLNKGGHKWETSTSSTAAYVIQDGYVVYVKQAATCSQTGKGYMICTAEDCGVQSSTVTINTTDHNFKTMPASEATCQTPGHTAYQACRNCPYAEEPVRIPKLGHADTNSNGKCDRCGFEMYVPDNGGTAACGCMCHDDSFFMAKIIYPIVRFFWKIFRMNKSCSCGNVHY